MGMVSRKLLLFTFVMLAAYQLDAQTAEETREKETRKFILKVLSKQKNPMSYYPLRRDIFLPSEEEIVKDEFEKSYPEGSRSIGHIVFLAANDTTYKREPFIDANGDLLELSFIDRKSQPSLKSNSGYFQKRQQGMLNKYPSLGRFLYFNKSFGDSESK